MPSDKYGNKLSWSEYFSKWKQGIANVTPLQQTNITIRGTWIILAGVTGGLIISLTSIKTLWWLVLILSGALVNTIVQQLGQYQKKNILDTIEKGGYE